MKTSGVGRELGRPGLAAFQAVTYGEGTVRRVRELAPGGKVVIEIA